MPSSMLSLLRSNYPHQDVNPFLVQDTAVVAGGADCHATINHNSLMMGVPTSWALISCRWELDLAGAPDDDLAQRDVVLRRRYDVVSAVIVLLLGQHLEHGCLPGLTDDWQNTLSKLNDAGNRAHVLGDLDVLPQHFQLV